MPVSSGKILIVDDDEATRRLLRRLLGDKYRLAEAATGEEAMERLPQFRPDLAILDVVMPGMDGHETCRRIRRSPFGRQVRVMMISARSSSEDKAQAFEAGADDYLIKPFDPQELRSRVVRALFRRPTDLNVGGGRRASADGRSDIPAPGELGR